MGKFGWDLPPGCTMADIDRAFGDQPTFTEDFEAKLTDEEKAVWGKVYELDDGLQQLIERAMAWANELGYEAHQADEAEYQYYCGEQRQRRLPKIRAYFKALRQKAGS